MVAFALRADGWFLRQDVIWWKTNAMPEPVRDRPTKAHEHVFLLAKSECYFFDAAAIAEECSEPQPATRGASRGEHKGNPVLGQKRAHRQDRAGFNMRWNAAEDGGERKTTRNARSVWPIATEPFPGAHFATMPRELARRLVLSSTSDRGACPGCGAPWIRDTKRTRTIDGVPAEDVASFHGRTFPDGAAAAALAGVGHKRIATVVETLGWGPSCACGTGSPVPCAVLDPFCGAGTTGLVATGHGRAFVGIEINPTYAELARERIGMFATVEHPAPAVASKSTQ